MVFLQITTLSFYNISEWLNQSTVRGRAKGCKTVNLIDIEKKPIRVSMVRPKTTIMIKCHSFSCDSVPLRPFVCTYVHFSYIRAPNGLFLEKGGGGIPSKTELRLLYLMRPRSHHIFCLLSRLLNMKIRLQKNVYIFLQPPEA